MQRGSDLAVRQIGDLEVEIPEEPDDASDQRDYGSGHPESDAGAVAGLGDAESNGAANEYRHEAQAVVGEGTQKGPDGRSDQARDKTADHTPPEVEPRS